MTQSDPDLVCVAVPGETSTVITPDGKAHAVHINEHGRRVIWVNVEQARTMLNSGQPGSLAWRESNPLLAEALPWPPRNRR